jgi:hypothetical protein
MKVLQYAISKSFNTKLIPRIDPGNNILYTEKLYTSRTIKNIAYKPTDSPYEGIENSFLENDISYWSDYKYDNIKYELEYSDYEFISNINSNKNLLDKVLSFNPKQVGIVNKNISKVFCSGNEIHYSLIKHGFVPMIYSELTDTQSSDKRYNRNIKQNEKILGWGEISINNILFASIIDTFSSFKESQKLVEDTVFYYNMARRVSTDDLNVLEYVPFITNDGFQYGPSFIYTTGSKAGNCIANVDDDVYMKYSIKLSKNIDFSPDGSLKGVINKKSGLRLIDENMKKMYFWRSGLITTIDSNKNVTYYLLVGIKPKRYNLSKEIDKIFFIDLGNTLNNTKFDSSDIILYYSDLKTFIKKTSAELIYFSNLSFHILGNICPNGLIFGADSTLLTDIVNSINTGNSDFCTIDYEINNIYNIFTNLEE